MIYIAEEFDKYQEKMNKMTNEFETRENLIDIISIET
jgi:hypothetical protein